MRKIPNQREAEIITKYINSNKLLSNNKLAQLIINDYGNTLTNKANMKHLVSAVKKNMTRSIQTAFNIDQEPEDFILPQSLYKDAEAFEVPSAINKILILSDIHIPYQNNTALRLALQYGKQHGISAILLNGDIIDFYGLSRFIKDPNLIDINKELEFTKLFFRELRKYFGDIPIYYKIGNHEERLEHKIQAAAPELFNVDNVRIAELLQFRLYNITEVADKRNIRIGKLNVIHGHELFGAAGQINVARNVRLKTFANIMVGHYHRTQSDFQRKVTGEVVGGWAVGCLCGLSPLWLPINNWNNGFAIVEQDVDGNFEVHNKMIVGGVVK